MIALRTIISGGQTGSDRGALLAAHDLGLQRGGMAPLGWRAEDGAIPPWFRAGMTQSASVGYPVRTRANVEASGGTLIVSFGLLAAESGSKPLLAIQLGERGWLSDFAKARVVTWLGDWKIVTLNVAGPREGREPGIQAATRAALNAILADELGFGGR